MISKIRNRMYTYLILKWVKKKQKAEEKIHHYIYKKFGWEE